MILRLIYLSFPYKPSDLKVCYDPKNLPHRFPLPAAPPSQSLLTWGFAFAVFGFGASTFSLPARITEAVGTPGRLIGGGAILELAWKWERARAGGWTHALSLPCLREGRGGVSLSCTRLSTHGLQALEPLANGADGRKHLGEATNLSVACSTLSLQLGHQHPDSKGLPSASRDLASVARLRCPHLILELMACSRWTKSQHPMHLDYEDILRERHIW